MPSSSISDNDAPLGLNTLPDDMLRDVMSFLTLSSTAAFSYASRVTRDAFDDKTKAHLAASECSIAKNEVRAEKETRIAAQMELEEVKVQLATAQVHVHELSQRFNAAHRRIQEVLERLNKMSLKYHSK